MCFSIVLDVVVFSNRNCLSVKHGGRHGILNNKRKHRLFWPSAGGGSESQLYEAITT